MNRLSLTFYFYLEADDVIRKKVETNTNIYKLDKS